MKIHTIQIETACRSPLKRQPRHMPKISIPPQWEIYIAICVDTSAAEWRLIWIFNFIIQKKAAASP